MELWQAVVLGLVEGITEYLPVSSTGHLILAEWLTGLRTAESAQHKAAVDALTIVVQGGAILAVLFLYWPRVLQMLRGLAGRDRAGLRLLINLLIAFLPAAVIGKLANEWIEAHLFSVASVAGAMVAGGVYMLVVERLRTRGAFARRAAQPPPIVDPGAPEGRPDDLAGITPLKALFIGLMQVVAMWPGTSRSMMTITAGQIAGLRPAAAAEFSFLLGLPTLGAATLYKLYKSLRSGGTGGADDHGDMFHVLGTVPVIIALIVSAVSAACAVKWLVAYLNRHGLGVFAWYRIVVGGVLLALLGAGVLRF